MTGSDPLIGRVLSHYRIVEKLGAGGMGVVYKAQDTALGRFVALKFLPDELLRESEALERFQREARAASALNHPNICTVYEIGNAEGRSFLAMEYLEGQTLKQQLNGKPLPLEQVLSFGIQLGEGLEAAHCKGVIHRDIKPANLFITTQGLLKILDFGLAKLTPFLKNFESGDKESQSTLVAEIELTSPGTTLGTIAYMSPEQALGEQLDTRTDIFSCGVALYEMATGISPFFGTTTASIFDAVLNKDPVPAGQKNRAVPSDLEKIISRTLMKKREKRYHSARELVEDLKLLRQASSGPMPVTKLIRKPRFLVPAAAALAGLALFGAWMARREHQVRWVHEFAIPELQKLALERKGVAFYKLAQKAERFSPGDPTLKQVETQNLWPNAILSTPSGADVFFRDYGNTRAGWEYLGKTPLEQVNLVWAQYDLKFVKEGYEPLEVTSEYFSDFGAKSIILDTLGSLPKNMVHIPPAKISVAGLAPTELDDFLIDKYEVTNLEFKKFIDGDGYRDPKYWKFPFVKDSRTLSFDQAMAVFVDKTDRPAPSTWDVGNYPQGQDNYPVSGVSWYEAAAYAEFAGKSLPTVFRWYQAASMGGLSDILETSNFSGQGPAPVGSYAGLGPYGTYDMAGNVKEWCFNSDGSRRYILGGASTEPKYMYQLPDARPPFDRSATNGFRLVKYLKTGPLPEAQSAVVSFESIDFRKVRPVLESVFRIYEELYSYDRTPLDAKIVSVDDSSPNWRREQISFKAAYDDERVAAFLYLPKNVLPPFQTVVYFPGVEALDFHTFTDLNLFNLDFLMKSGRAVFFPIYKGTYERFTHRVDFGSSEERDEVIQRSKDLRRSLDYLGTRSDIDQGHLAFYGFSWGGYEGPITLALESRFKTAVLADGGCDPHRKLPEVDPMNFAPHVKIPVLMINGRYDFMISYETCQQPFFRLLGTPALDKRQVLLESGHGLPYTPWFRETLDWLDLYLGRAK
jgi:serine/threonine protein kinase/dienelactone hydrolase